MATVAQAGSEESLAVGWDRQNQSLVHKAPFWSHPERVAELRVCPQFLRLKSTVPGLPKGARSLMVSGMGEGPESGWRRDNSVGWSFPKNGMMGDRELAIGVGVGLLDS